MLKANWTFTESITMVTDSCANCGIIFGMPYDYNAELRRTGKSFHCPNGHSLVYRKPKIDTEKEELRKQLEESKNKLGEVGRKLELVDFEWNKTLKKNAKLTKEMKRVHKGVCPCCNRTFSNLAQHMETKHKDIINKK